MTIQEASLAATDWIDRRKFRRILPTNPNPRKAGDTP